MFYEINGIFPMPFFDVDDTGGSGISGAGDTSNNGAPEKTFTQAELDEIIAQRLERERKKYADYDELKTKLTEFEQAEEERKKAEMTEQERLQAEKEEAARRAAEAEQSAQAAIEAANQRLVKSEFKLRAAAMGVLQNALDDAFVLADLSGVTVNDDGEVDGEALDSAIIALISNKPFLKAEVKQTVPKSIGQPSGGSDDEEIKTLEAELESAKKKKDFSKVVKIYNELKSKRGK